MEELNDESSELSASCLAAGADGPLWAASPSRFRFKECIAARPLRNARAPALAGFFMAPVSPAIVLAVFFRPFSRKKACSAGTRMYALSLSILGA